jgi:outer membrane protein TolC
LIVASIELGLSGQHALMSRCAPSHRSLLGGLMRSLTKLCHFVLPLCSTCWLLAAGGVRAQNADALADYPKETTRDSRARKQLLSPMTIDEKYLGNGISAEVSQSTLTLCGAVAESAVHNKEVQEARLEISRYRWEFFSAETNRLPNVRILSYLADQTVKSELVPARGDAFLFMSALVPITQQYRIGLEARAIKMSRIIAEEKLRQRLDETRAKVKAAYYKLVLDQSLLSDVQDSIKYLSELKTTVADQVKHGNSLKVEEMEVAAKLAKAQYEETKACNAFSIDREKFNQFLGRELKTGVILEAIPAPGELELDIVQAECQALSMRPEIRQADARVKQVNLEKRIIMSEYIPNVSAGLVWVALPGFNNKVVPRNILAPGLFINWNAWDWGRKAMQAKARGKVERSSMLSADTAREDVLIDLHTQINKLAESRQLVSTTQLARAASRERMRVSFNRYKYTSAKLSDVLEAQSSLADANNSYHQAMLAFWEAKAQFDRAVGTNQ